MKIRHRFFGALALSLLLLAATWLLPALTALLSRRMTRPVAADALRTIVLDAGHGGIDGGAESVTGTSEKTLNLSLSRTAAALFRLCGYTVAETRTTDTLLDLPVTSGSRKTRDLAARLQIAREHPSAILISIHMNKFPLAKYSGLQVYYGESHPNSRVLAEAIQTATRTHLQPNNRREIKPATSAIYLLYRAEMPAVLVECGFLSNPDEAAALERTSYRQTLALLLVLGVQQTEQTSAQAAG